MRSWIWLRSLAVVLAIFTLGHTLGTAAPKVTRGEREATLFTAMQSYRFPIMGFDRSYWDFYRGLAITISVLMLLMTVFAWQLGTLSRRDPLAAARPFPAGCWRDPRLPRPGPVRAGSPR